MRTLHLIVDPNQPDQASSRASIETAARLLRDGGTVAFPTETVYGLGANALRAESVQKIFEAKQRPSWDPLIVHIAGTDMLHRVAYGISPLASRLMDLFWPGPLTLLLPRHPNIPEIVTAGRSLVGVRMPRHPVARALIQTAGVPLAAPSANTFGHTSPTSAQHVADDLDGRIDAILDAGGVEEWGDTMHGLESTVVDPTKDHCIVYRQGAIPLESIRALCPDAEVFHGREGDSSLAPEAHPSPGLGIRHYAPRARLLLVPDGPDQVQRFAARAAAVELSGETLGLMMPDSFAGTASRKALVYRWGNWSDHEQLAQRLYSGLRWLDAAGATVILCPMPEPRGIGAAIRDRLQKAARID